MNSDAERSQTAKRPPINPDAVKAVTEAYYTRGVEAPDRARGRAEKGYTIASAIAAALVAAGVFAHLNERAIAVQVLGVIGLLLWLVAAVLFIWVVSAPTAPVEPDPDQVGDEAFIGGVVNATVSELKIIRNRLMAALGMTLAATLVTAAALATATFLPEGHDPEPAKLALSAKADEALSGLCSRPIGDVFATVDPDDLESEVVELDIPAGACNAAKTTVRVHKNDIISEKVLTRFPGFPRP